MATANFNYENRCILVTDESYEIGDVPPLGDYYKESLRSFPARLLEKADFTYFDVVFVSGYYGDACIDYRHKDKDGNEIISSYLGYPYYFNTKKEVYENVCKYIENMSYKKFSKIVGDINGRNMDDFIEEAFIKLQTYFSEKEEEKVNQWLDELKKEYGYEELEVRCTFSNGETFYSKVG